MTGGGGNRVPSRPGPAWTTVSGEGAVRALLVLATALMSAVQIVAAMALGAQWGSVLAGSRDGCGYDGTCADRYALPASVAIWLVLLVVDAGSVLVAVARWRTRRSGERSGQDLAGFLIAAIAKTMLGTCLLVCGLLVQTVLLGAFGDTEDVTQIPAANSDFLGRNLAVIGAEVMLAAAALLIRARRRTRAGTAGSRRGSRPARPRTPARRSGTAAGPRRSRGGPGGVAGD